MFGIGIQELGIVLVVALLVFGPRRLPELARTLGKGMAEFRKASTELRRTVNLELNDPPPNRDAPAQPDPRTSKEEPGGPPQTLADNPPPDLEPARKAAIGASPAAAEATEPTDPTESETTARADASAQEASKGS